MTALIILFAALMLLSGIVMLVKPALVFDFLKRQSDQPMIQILAVVIRLILGYLLVSQAAASRFPLTIEILGWIAIAAAIMLAVIGRERFKRLMRWAFSLAGSLGRFAGLLATAFGAFLIYAFI